MAPGPSRQSPALTIRSKQSPNAECLQQPFDWDYVFDSVDNSPSILLFYSFKAFTENSKPTNNKNYLFRTFPDTRCILMWNRDSETLFHITIFLPKFCQQSRLTVLILCGIFIVIFFKRWVLGLRRRIFISLKWNISG